MRRGAKRWWESIGLGVLTTVLVTAVVMTAVACSSDAPTTQLADDPSDVTIAGPRPTAPPPPSGGLSASGNDLIAQLQALQSQPSFCDVIGADAFTTLRTGEVDAAALVTNPSGVAQLVAVVDATFTHVVAISPPEIKPSMQVISDVWRRLVRLGGAADAKARSQQILAEPTVVEANKSVLTWAVLNCPEIVSDALAGGAAG